ncbi:ankyrin repeat-containing domain protein [Dactylonectria macrodidyma]|uniref:Ankyrin repeat-containing domain protein n=1 Tax=Dactylonectria macrodidyma TaxID=307937 RepID=A0A9P9D126_9HYPO|nr:ankyrin repeat-containing domain protein [Dactylonectria macrodidyma]
MSSTTSLASSISADYLPPQSTETTDLPLYTPIDNASLYKRIERDKALKLPIMRAPEHWRDHVKLQNDIITSFFSFIETGHDDLVTDFIARGLVSPDTTNSYGETPLLAAVRMRNVPMVSKLVSLGATVDGYGRIREKDGEDYNNTRHPERTPLQYAAWKGNLALVRVLMGDYGANDALIAPDGAITLRLAAMKGHREIVEYLPARRGGEWLRWKTSHRKEMKRVQRALKAIGEYLILLTWHIPKFFLFDIPRYFIYSLPKSYVEWAWERRHQFSGWCKREITELPGRIKRGIREVLEWIKEIPTYIKELTQEAWKYLKGLAGLPKIIALWVGHGLRCVGEAAIKVILRFLSFLHTLVMAIVSFFQEITFKDVWNGFYYVLWTISTEVQAKTRSIFVRFLEMSLEVLWKILDIFAAVVCFSCVGFVWLTIYIPVQLWKSAKAMGRSMRRGYQEGMAYLDPKRI